MPPCGRGPILCGGSRPRNMHYNSARGSYAGRGAAIKNGPRPFPSKRPGAGRKVHDDRGNNWRDGPEKHPLTPAEGNASREKSSSRAASPPRAGPAGTNGFRSVSSRGVPADIPCGGGRQIPGAHGTHGRDSCNADGKAHGASRNPAVRPGGASD